MQIFQKYRHGEWQFRIGPLGGASAIHRKKWSFQPFTVGVNKKARKSFEQNKHCSPLQMNSLLIKGLQCTLLKIFQLLNYSSTLSNSRGNINASLGKLLLI